MNHITGGGFMRIFHVVTRRFSANIDTQAFPTPNVFNWLQQQANIDTKEMYNVFNMGIGFTVIIDKKMLRKHSIF